MYSPDYFMKSRRLGFRCWTANDMQIALELWGDERVTKLFSKEPWTGDQIQDRLLREIEGQQRYAVQYWPIFELETSQAVGCAGLRPYAVEKKVYELGFHLRPQFWGCGYATESGATVIRYAFDILKAEALFAGHHPDNLSSSKVLLKLGFERAADEFYEPTGLFHPSYFLPRCPQI